MVNENKILIENKKPVEIVYELKDYEIKKSPLSPAARSKVVNKSGSDYFSESKSDYGPCKNSLCGCSCSSYTCNCESAGLKIEEWGSSIGVSRRMWEEDIDSEDKITEGMTKRLLKRAGKPMRGVGGQFSSSLLGYKDEGGEFKVLSGTASSEVSGSGIKCKLSADLCNVKAGGVQVRAGIGVDTGISVEDGLEVKAIGFGFSVGKQTGISTPFGEIKFDTEDCVIQ